MLTHSREPQAGSARKADLPTLHVPFCLYVLEGPEGPEDSGPPTRQRRAAPRSAFSVHLDQEWEESAGRGRQAFSPILGTSGVPGRGRAGARRRPRPALPGSSAGGGPAADSGGGLGRIESSMHCAVTAGWPVSHWHTSLSRFQVATLAIYVTLYP
jgi:hypothetical protein